jgi:hypothetical protein
MWMYQAPAIAALARLAGDFAMFTFAVAFDATLSERIARVIPSLKRTLGFRRAPLHALRHLRQLFIPGPDGPDGAIVFG